jgi:hypothetical protein
MVQKERIIPIDILLAMARGEINEDEAFRLAEADEKVERDPSGNAKVEAAIEARDQEERRRQAEARAALKDARAEASLDHDDTCGCNLCRRHRSRKAIDDGTLRAYGADSPGPFSEEVAVQEQVRLHPLD